MKYQSLTYLRHTIALIMWGCCMMAHAQMFTNIRATQTMTVKVIVEDKENCIWFASGKSLYRFDGKSITTFSNETLDRLGAIKCVVATDHGMLVGCERGMAELDAERGTCEEVEELHGRVVKCLLQVNQHNWAGTDSSLYIDCQPTAIKGDITDMCRTRSGIMIARQGGIVMLNTEGKEVSRQKVTNIPYLTRIVEDQPDKLLIGTVRGVMHYDMKRELLYADTFRLPVVKCMLRDERGVLMIGCDGGLYECDDELRPIRHDARNPRSFAGNVVWCMMKDHAGNLWMGTDNGLSVMASDQSFVIYNLASITESGQGNQIYCTYKDSEGRLWMGGTNGIVRVNHFGRKNQNYLWYEMNNPNHPLPHNRIRMFYEDPVWGMWACTDGGLLHYDEELEQWQMRPIPEDAHNWVYSVDREAEALVVNTFDGVYRLSLDDTGREITETQHIEAKPCLDSPYGSIQLGSSEWVLTPNGLVVRKDGNEHRIDLPEKFVSIYYHAAEDRIYLGGADQFAIINPKTFLNHEAKSLWFDADARFADEPVENAFSRRMIIALSIAVLTLCVVLVLYFQQRKRLKMERTRRHAMLKSANDKMALLEKDNSNLHQQLRFQNLAVRTATKTDNESGNEQDLPAEEQYLLRVNKIIEQHIDDPDFSIATLSEVMGISQKQLYRKIKQYSDLTTVEYIRKIRLQKAATLLQNPAFTINEVMYMVGFSNPSYFSRSFVAEFGMTPTAYRANQG